MTTLPASATRIPPQVFGRVAHAGERVRVERRGGDVVYIVSARDMALLEKLEDEFWAKEGSAALAEFEDSGEKPIPWEQTKAELVERVLLADFV